MGWLITILSSVALVTTLVGVVYVLTDRDMLRPFPVRATEGYIRIRQPRVMWVLDLLLSALGFYLQINLIITGIKNIIGASTLVNAQLDFTYLFMTLLFLLNLGVSTLVILIAIQVRYCWFEYNEIEIRRHWIGKHRLVRIPLDRPENIRLVVTDTIEIVEGSVRIVMSRHSSGADHLLELLEAKGIQRYQFTK